MDPAIQPEEIKVGIVPEIVLSETLRAQIKTMLEEEENSYTEVSDKTTVVQTDKNYVFFSNQWFYLAVICKKYAMGLYPYCEFFDNKIKANTNVLNCIKSKNYNDPVLLNFFENETDMERMIKFVNGDKEFRPGKNLLNDAKNTKDTSDANNVNDSDNANDPDNANDSNNTNDFKSNVKTRSCKDIFCSCILGKLSVPNASSTYLGNLVYYLAKRPELFDKLEVDVKRQIGQADSAIKLPSGIKDCAKAIIDCVYRIDSFDKLKPLIEINEKNIKINTSNMEGDSANGNFLRYLFARPNSDLYNTEGSDKPRVFTDKTYAFEIDGSTEECRLTTEWVDTDISQVGNGNYLRALIEVINVSYAGLIRVTEEAGARYLVILNNSFSLSGMPTDFTTDYSRRYITSLLAKPFVILTGNSGTGKTRIAKQFAEYLEVNTESGEKNWTLIPVGADWTDNSKILGFYNPLAYESKGEYVKTSIVKMIESANENKSIPYFLILDEMNLSHVERYFSDFLSHMETPEITFMLDGYEGKLEFPSNLFVIGTVNIDETTYMFSPKVLDRANVVEFKPEKTAVMDLFLNPVSSNMVHAANDGSAEAFLKLSKEIRSGKCGIEAQMEDAKNFFNKVYAITEKYEFEFSYRTVKEIRQYISAAYEISKESHEFSLTNSLDEQLLQKVLPKIHGNKKEIGEMLDELEKICNENKMILSEMKIKQMKGKLAKIQYASFI
jgi:hypothetical protein